MNAWTLLVAQLGLGVCRLLPTAWVPGAIVRMPAWPSRTGLRRVEAPNHVFHHVEIGLAAIDMSGLLGVVHTALCGIDACKMPRRTSQPFTLLGSQVSVRVRVRFRVRGAGFKVRSPKCWVHGTPNTGTPNRALRTELEHEPRTVNREVRTAALESSTSVRSVLRRCVLSRGAERHPRRGSSCNCGRSSR